jgi:hypothetical protein
LIQYVILKILIMSLKNTVRCFLPVIASLLLVNSCTADRYEAAYETRINDYKSLIANFKNPSSEFRAAPFWVWHEIVTEEKIESGLKDLKDKGFGGVFVHPRYGMVTEYLSEEWFDLFEYTLKVADRLGMYVWIYDENSYPSGFAGGHVPDQMPDSYIHGQALRIHRMNEFNPEPALAYLHFFEVKEEGILVELAEPDERKGDIGEFILYEVVNYPVSKWKADHSYVDLLYPGVTEKFMEITMTGYKDRFGEHFGRLIPGVFTDEPNIAPPGGRTAVKWTPDLYDEFEEKWGYRLQDNLLSLFEERGDWKRVRHNYFQVLLQMFVDRWSKPWYEFTEEHQLKWTGHYWEHGWPSPHHGGDNMAMYAWHQIPAIDLLFSTMYTLERPTQFGNVRNVKEVRSAANQTGRKRTLCEAYGGAGWELTFEEMKRFGDWMYVLGINFMNQHMTYMTLLGDRKHDFPQSISYHAPWWELYGHQNDYFARLSVAMSAGEQNNDILVIEPTSTTWMYYSSDSPNPYLDEIAVNFDNLLDNLEMHKVGYDLGSENIIKDIGRIENGQFFVGKAGYSLVVLPFGMENIDIPTFELLKRFMDDGGMVVSLGTVPGRLDGEATDMINEVMDDYRDKWKHASCFTDADVYHLFANKKIRFNETSMKSKWFYHHTRELDDGRLLFLVNSSPDDIFKGKFSTKGRTVIILDPATGDQSLYPFSISSEEITADFAIEPAGSLLLFISDKEISVSAKRELPVADVAMPGEINSVIALSHNMFTLDYGELIIEGESKGRMYFYTAGDKVWQHYGYPDNPWANSIQFKTRLIDADTFAVDTGFGFIYDFNIEEGVDMRSIRAIAERPEIFKLEINDAILEPLEDTWMLDRDFAVYELGDHLRKGKNFIRLTVKPMRMLAELQPVYLAGIFSLGDTDGGWDIVPEKPLSPGSWREFGYPFYSDRVMYTRTESFSVIPERVVVQLGRWNGTVAEVKVNGHPAGIIQQPPYIADITGFLQTGENKVDVIVFGSNKNLLGPHHNDRRGIVTPWSFKYASDIQPPGKEYDLNDYGLLEDFAIKIADNQ